MKRSSCFVLFVLGMSLAAAKLPSFGLGGLKDKLPSLGGLLGGKAAFPSLVTFGDSMTDTGNVFKLTNGTFPDPAIYYDGRFTNSPGSWADIVNLVTTPLNAGLSDYSFGGATACHYPNIKGKQATIPSMEAQVEAYLNRTDRPKGKKIIVLWGGHNDIMSAVKLPPKEIRTVPTRIVTCLLGMAKKIIAADKDATVLIGSLAPLNSTPYLGKLSVVGTLVRGLNTVINLATKALALKYRGRVAYWDINAVLSEAITEAPSLGFTFNVSQPCVTYKASFEGLFKDFSLKPKGTCDFANGHVFYDPVHPSSAAHRVITKSYLNKLLELKLIDTLPGSDLLLG